MELNFRTLAPQEIECRVQECKQKGAILLVYKTARVDYAVLDESVGAFNWKIDYREIKGNLYCGISIYDKDKNEWITKWNAGDESDYEKTKGEASDACKRAGFVWGIGRELYTAPFIWINLSEAEVFKNNKGGFSVVPSLKFEVSEIGYDAKRNINKLVITDNNGAVRYSHGSNKKAQVATVKAEPLAPKVVKTEPTMSKIQQTPMPETLTQSELSIIAKNERLLSEMRNCCGNKKFDDYGISEKRLITNYMRKQIENENRSKQ